MAIRIYFRKIDVIGSENLPKKGAAIYIVNHPSALLDPLVVATLAGRQLHFIAAAEYFGKKIKSWFFQKQFNMIPVYRPKIHTSENVNNDHMFLHCFNTLDNGGVIIIFPEGNSETEKRLRKLKTGVVRMVLGAEKRNGIKVPIFPIGINYTNPHRFQSDVFVSIGKPILLDHRIDPDDKQGVIKQTSIVEEKLKEHIIHIDDEHLETTIQRIEQIFAKQLQQNLGISNKELTRKFTVAKDVINAVEYFESKSPDSTKSIYKIIGKYYKIIEDLPMHGRLLNHINSKRNFSDYLIIIFLFPVFLFGFLVNSIPYYFSSKVFKNKYLKRIKGEDLEHQIRPVFSGSIAFGIGTMFFIVWYILLGIISIVFFPWWWGIIFLFASYWTGYFTLKYLGVLRRVIERSKLKNVTINHPAKMKELILLRGEIIDELKKFSEKYRSKDNKANG
ncbi:MAG: 1-acyl-sn-glycerol-3-phosphate acyltransferase [Cyclobacteriaceae bacterium]|nr:1-acyl-sn-glycerol-3-phosphate acyltransferase [Cyclobacteriaceae bacterium]